MHSSFLCFLGCFSFKVIKEGLWGNTTLPVRVYNRFTIQFNVCSFFFQKSSSVQEVVPENDLFQCQDENRQPQCAQIVFNGRPSFRPSVGLQPASCFGCLMFFILQDDLITFVCRSTMLVYIRLDPCRVLVKYCHFFCGLII